MVISSTHYYKKQAELCLQELDNTTNIAEASLLYDDMIWWLYLYNQSKEL